MTSRVTDVMIGVIMSATTTPAMKLDPTIGSPSRSRRKGNDREVAGEEARDRRQVRLQHLEPPQTEQEAGERREQVDRRRQERRGLGPVRTR